MHLLISEGNIVFNGEALIEDINFEINDKSKIALIGRNGCGKTSFLRVLQGEVDLTFDSSSNGTYSRTNDFSIGYLSQIALKNEESTLEEAILECYKKIIDVEKKLNIAQEKMITNPCEENINEYSSLHDLYENMDGYCYQKEYHTVLKKFSFTKKDFSKKIKEFSGGERTKIAFIKLLLSKPDLLLLDEPTNHLDLQAIEWLEEYLKNYRGAFIVVSHDREFINKVCNEVYEIEYNKMERYVGNYSDYIKEKEIRKNSNHKKYVEQQKHIAKEKELIERFRYKATKAKMVQSRIKALDKLEIISEPKKEYNKRFKMEINPLTNTGKEVFNISNLEFGYDKSLAKLNIIVEKGEKLAIIGENGSGKSTLLKTIIRQLKPISGEIKNGFNVKIGYFDQNSAYTTSNKTILEDYKDTYPSLDNQQVRNDLGAFLFINNDVNKRLNVLSGGELVRYSLCKLFKTRPNVLVLDEPTNHMDIYSKETIEKMLMDYKGTIILVSHDRYFVRKISNSLVEISDGVCNYYPYGYNQYMEKKVNNKFVVKNEVKISDNISKVSKIDCKKEISNLEKEISIIEQEINKINLSFEDEEVYTDFMVMQEKEQQLEDLEDKLAILMRKWEEYVKIMEG